LDFAINSDPVVRLAFWGGLGAVALTLLLLMQIVFLRLKHRRNARRRREFMSKWDQLLTENVLVNKSPLRLPAIPDEDVVRFLAYWINLHNSMRGQARERLDSLARTIDIEKIVRRMLQNGSNAEKLLATIGIGFFGNKTDIPELKKLLVSERPIDCLHAASAILRLDAGALGDVLPIIAWRSDISTASIASILQEQDMDGVSLLLAEMLGRVYRDVEPHLRMRRRDIVRLIMLASTAQPSVVRPYLLEILDKTNDDEVITACLKVMRDPLELPRMREFINHPNWHVRVQIASALGEMGEEKDLMLLIRLLSDSQWWVRYRAAQAISALPYVTTSHLEGMKSLLGDGFAIDMINQVLAERVS
jgi:HEAT repeat protein